jgi:lambda repressor-like predicted transcriptional regulator
MFRTRIEPRDLYKAMQREGLSQNETARRAGVSTATLSSVMKGKCCSARVGKAICDALHADPDKLLKMIEE